MTKEQIKAKVNYNNQKIQELLDPSIFILQPEVMAYMEDNTFLQSQCSHEYVDGVCTICGKAE